MTNEEISDLLFARDEPIPADLIMVFAAATEEDLIRRTRHGVDLYQQGYAPRLLVSGGGTLALTHPEAVRMGDLARRLGVPEGDLLVDSRSSNTFANARYSVELLREHGLLDELKTVILVSSEWHMRRVLLTVKATFPPGLCLVCSPTSEGCVRETWAASETCRAEILQELSILQAFRESGLLPP
jgi:uncharacterized SAM-binding protein YcdF (DUF218 family)